MVLKMIVDSHFANWRELASGNFIQNFLKKKQENTFQPFFPNISKLNQSVVVWKLYSSVLLSNWTFFVLEK